MSSREKRLIFSFVLVFAATASAVQDPELELCRVQRGKQRQYDAEEVRDCRNKCEWYYREKKRREREGERGGGGDSNPEDPFKKLMECEGKCVQKRDERQRSITRSATRSSRERGRRREGVDEDMIVTRGKRLNRV